MQQNPVPALSAGLTLLSAGMTLLSAGFFCLLFAEKHTKSLKNSFKCDLELAFNHLEDKRFRGMWASRPSSHSKDAKPVKPGNISQQKPNQHLPTCLPKEAVERDPAWTPASAPWPGPREACAAAVWNNSFLGYSTPPLPHPTLQGLMHTGFPSNLGLVLQQAWSQRQYS